MRNAVDHGIEAPEVRRAAGKPAEGRLLLRAFHESGQVIIEISDDGTGLDVDRIKRKALERGIVTPEQAERMSDREATQLIFKVEGGEDQLLQVVVHSVGDRSVGLVVERILDIVEEVVRIQRPSPKSGLVGSAVIQSRVTEVLDVDAFVRAAEPALFLEPVGAEG